jgi:hypothetical protein
MIREAVSAQGRDEHLRGSFGNRTVESLEQLPSASGSSGSTAGPERYVADDQTDLVLHHLPPRVAAKDARRHIIGVVRHVPISVGIGGRWRPGMNADDHMTVMAIR